MSVCFMRGGETKKRQKFKHLAVEDNGGNVCESSYSISHPEAN